MARDNVKRKSYAIKRRSHAIPERSTWSGRDVTEDDVHMAAGHALDVLPKRERLWAHREIERNHARAFQTRTVKEHWGCRLLVGEKGTGKTTIMVILAAMMYELGFPVFHTGSLLFGRELAVDEIYNSISTLPDNSVLAVDEAHVFFGLGSDTSRPSKLWRDGLAGLRKANCDVIMGTASDDELSGRVKAEVEEVLIPVKPELYNVRLDRSREAVRRRMKGLPPRGLAPKGSAMFRLWYYEILNRPYQRGGGIRELYGLAPKPTDPKAHPVYRHRLPEDLVRTAMLLNDSFRRVPVGAGMSINRQVTVNAAGDHLFGGAEEIANEVDEATGLTRWQGELLGLYKTLAEAHHDDGHRLTRKALHEMAKSSMEPAQFANHLREVLQVQPNTRGYLVGEVLDALESSFSPA